MLQSGDQLREFALLAPVCEWWDMLDLRIGKPSHTRESLHVIQPSSNKSHTRPENERSNKGETQKRQKHFPTAGDPGGRRSMHCWEVKPYVRFESMARTRFFFGLTFLNMEERPLTMKSGAVTTRPSVPDQEADGSSRSGIIGGISGGMIYMC
jgi:hypothetical protein